MVIDGEKDGFQAVGEERRERAALNGLPAGLSKPCAEDAIIIGDETTDLLTRIVHRPLTGAKSPVAPRRQEPIRSPDRRRSSARVPL